MITIQSCSKPSMKPANMRRTPNASTMLAHRLRSVGQPGCDFKTNKASKVSSPIDALWLVLFFRAVENTLSQCALLWGIDKIPSITFDKGLRICIPFSSFISPMVDHVSSILNFGKKKCQSFDREQTVQRGHPHKTLLGWELEIFQGRRRGLSDVNTSIWVYDTERVPACTCRHMAGADKTRQEVIKYHFLWRGMRPLLT